MVLKKTIPPILAWVIVNKWIWPTIFIQYLFHHFHNLFCCVPIPNLLISIAHSTSLASSASERMVEGPCLVPFTFQEKWSWRVLFGIPYALAALLNVNLFSFTKSNALSKSSCIYPALEAISYITKMESIQVMHYGILVRDMT